MKTIDPTRNAVCTGTANTFSRLAALRGIQTLVEWNDADNAYYCNGEHCGPSIHGCYEWLNRQEGVLP